MNGFMNPPGGVKSDIFGEKSAKKVKICINSPNIGYFAEKGVNFGLRGPKSSSFLGTPPGNR
jgi:hypothetical protein